MKAAAFGFAAAFLAVVLTGLGQRLVPQERAPTSIEVRRVDPAESARPTPRSTHPRKVDRSVRHHHLGDYDNSGPGSSRSGSGSDNSGPGSGDSGSGSSGDSSND